MSRQAALAALAVALGLAFAGEAGAARFAVGVDRSASLARVAADIHAVTGGEVSWRLARMHVLVVDAPGVRGVGAVAGVRYAEWLGTRRRKLAFTPTDPLALKQWYLQFDHAFDPWPDPPLLPPVKVAIIDSGIDLQHPDLQGKVFAARSFVGGSAGSDPVGHGTFVAGVIAASLNGEGIAGIAFPAQLLVAKVVRSDRSISLEAEAEAIRWAADRGARVINLSLGGVRDPRHRERDTFSALEADAVDYAARKGAVLVAAVGNSDQAPETPWQYASYPAALPHVIGVSALARDGSIPLFSDRDPVYNDIAAPGVDVYSTLPRALTKTYLTCSNQGYSDCGPDEYRHADGTSFAAPQVAAAAALVLAVNPKLAANQVLALVERSADDVGPWNGCKSCPVLRDPLAGWGRLNVTRAVAAAQSGELPPADRFETNDDAGTSAQRLFGKRGSTTAVLDYWDDPVDVYRLHVGGARRLSITVEGPSRMIASVRLWRPGTPTVFGRRVSRFRVAEAVQRSGRVQLVYTIPADAGGSYFVQVRAATPGSGAYTLRWSSALAR